MSQPRTRTLGTIFISYRRSDSQGEAGRLFDDLTKHFGDDAVFMDVAAIEAGRDFRKAIDESVSKCGVLLVVMGPEWLAAKDEAGKLRLSDPTDFVRIETASALKRDIPVIPVLVRGATMPRAEQFPEDLKELAYRNCIELTHARWRSDIHLLTDALRRLLGDTGPITVPATPDQGAATTQSGTQQGVGTPQESTTFAAIDPVATQRVSRELAQHIGPIADIVVKRAAAHSNSVDELYLKVAEEIDDREQREKFLQGRCAVPSINTSHVATTTASTVPPDSAPMAPPNDSRLGTALPPTAKASSPWKYIFPIAAVAISLIAVLIIGARSGRSKTAEISQPMQTASTPPQPEVTAPPKIEPAQPTETPQENPKPKSVPVITEPANRPKSQRVRVSPEVALGLCVSKTLPTYPPVAKQAHISGAVVLQANISKEGKVESLQAVSGHPLLIPAAIDAVKQWQFNPFLVNDKPAPMATQITVTFTLVGK